MSSSRVAIAGKPTAPDTSGRVYFAKFLFWGAASALIFRFFWIAYKYAVNLFYYDEWGTYSSLIEPQAWWRIFLQEHAPHRQGLGVLVAAKLVGLAHGNSRVQAFTVAAAIVVAMFLATYLKVRVFGPISPWDAVIPIMFLGLGQWEVMLGAAGASPQAFPLLLLIVYCFAWIEGRGLWRNVLVLVVNFILIFTGYGILAAGITLLLFGLEAYQGFKAHEHGRAVAAIVCLGIAIASLASFFYGYRFDPAVECYQFPYHSLSAYPIFMGVMFAKFMGVQKGVELASIIGVAALLIAVVLLARHVRPLWKKTSPPHASRVIVILIGFSLIFSVATAVGRVCLGVEAARASRYVTLLIPAFLGTYFAILSRRNNRARAWLTGIFVLALLPSAVQRNHREIETFSARKQSWKQCYLAHEDIRFCDEEASFQLYPCPECIHLKQRLEFLKLNRLNLYAEGK